MTYTKLNPADYPIASKDEERKAITRIANILAKLGPQSYVATALEGCLEIADANIEWDMADSYKGRFEVREARCAELEQKNAQLQRELDRAQQQLDYMRSEMCCRIEAVTAREDMEWAQFFSIQTTGLAEVLSELGI